MDAQTGRTGERRLTTADLAGTASGPTDDGETRMSDRSGRPESDTDDRAGQPRRGASAHEDLEPLFTPQAARDFHERWSAVQTGFVDDPRQAVRQGDELVAQVMQNLAQTFATERARLEGQLDDRGEGATENLRLALRRYRSFFERLLSL